MKQLFLVVLFFVLPFLEFVVRVTEKKTNREVTGESCVDKFDIIGIIGEARYIKPRTKTQVNNAKKILDIQKVKNLVVLLL